MTVREMMEAIRDYGEVTINGWIVKQDRSTFYALDKYGRVKCAGSAAQVHNFVRANSPS